MDLYEILEVERSASDSEIKRSYRKLALRYHPDKVSEHEREEAELKFKEISRAYEILSDEIKRQEYDIYGSTEGTGMGGFSGNPFDGQGQGDYGAEDFYNFFNGMNGSTRNGNPKPANRTDDAQFEVDVTLKELYTGKVVKLTSTRNVICGHCQGTGARKKAQSKKCGSCNGEGYTTKIRRVGPGLVSQFHVDCEVCLGSGKILRDKDKCKHCLGSKVVEESKILEFEIAAGSRSGESVVLKGESDEYPGKVTGDVTLTFHCAPDKVFERKGDDLYAKKSIALVDALSGFSKAMLKHLDGRAIHVTTPKGKVIRPGDFIKIKGEGMPKKKSGWFRSPGNGDLYIEIEVVFPPDNWYLEKNDLTKLRNLFPGYQSEDLPGEPEENIQYVTDFPIISKSDLPKYEMPETETNGDQQHEHESAYDQPECATQ